MADKTLLEQVLGSQEGSFGVKIHNVREVPCTKPGDNYMSIVGLLEIEGTLPGGAPYSKSVFVKRQIESEQRRQLFHTEVPFQNEVVMYNEVLPLFEVTVPCPRCLFANSEVVYLENLRDEGYLMGTRHLGFDLAQATLVLKALARFHVASFHSLRVKNETFTAAVNHLKRTGFTITAVKEITETGLNRSIRQLEGQGVEEAFIFLQSLEQHFSVCLNMLRKPKDIVVLCHGDFWINNILIRDGEDPVRIVDLQTCALLSPAVDFWSFMYSSVQPSIMETAFPQLIETYCRAFIEELQRVPLEDTLTLNSLMDELLSRELYGFLVGMLYKPAILMDVEEVPDLDNISKEVFLDNDFMDQFVTPKIKGSLIQLSKFAIGRGLFKRFADFLNPSKV